MGRVSTAAAVASLATAASHPAQAQQSAASQASRGVRTYNIRDFGAKGDGQTLDTAAIQAAIDACTNDQGGTVLVPAGVFVVGTTQLKSNVTLHIAAGGRLLGSPKPADYSAGVGVPPGNGNIVVFYAVNAENITIEGPGTIDGQGKAFYIGYGDGRSPNRSPYVERPHLFIFYRCRNLAMRNIFLTNTAYHCCRILQSSYVNIEGVRIFNRVNHNNDGFHFNSSEYVKISDCNIACGDDACALFGSNKFVTVMNSTFSTRWSIFRFGGGQCENVTVSNCVINNTYGCAIKMSFGAGSRIENVSFSNLIMQNVTGPISIGLDSSSRRPGQEGQARPKGIVRNIAFNGIRAFVVEKPDFSEHPWGSTSRPGEFHTCITLNGVGDDYLENISFNDVQVTYAGGGTAEEAAVRDVPKRAGEYFELGVLPAYGMYARNVRGLTVSNVRFQVASPDLRPAVVFDHVEDSTLNGLSAQGNPKAESLMRFTGTRDTLISATRVTTPCAAFLRIEGPDNAGITIDGGDLSKAASTLAVAGGATKDAVKVRG